MFFEDNSKGKKSFPFNNTLLNRIGMGFYMQFPPDSYVHANNIWLNGIKGAIKQHRDEGYECLCHNEKCNGKAIDSHSIPKKNLEMMSENNKVISLKDDFKNPFKMKSDTSYTKSTLTFPGFCQYHDTLLFEKIENSDGSFYNQEDVFYLTYRALAKEYSDCRDEVDIIRWMLDNWNTDAKKKLDLENARFASCRMINFGRHDLYRKWVFHQSYFISRVVDKIRKKIEIKDRLKCKKILQEKLDQFNRRINEGSIFRMHYVVLDNKNKIAVSITLYQKLQGRGIFLYLINIPQTNGSQLIIACSQQDYELVKDEEEYRMIFEGDENLINDILNLFEEKIAIDGNDPQDETSQIADSFVREWNIPIARAKYFMKE